MSKPFEIADVTYYVFDPEDGVDEYETADAAESAALEVIDVYREESGDGWAEEAGQVHWGKLIKLGHSRETVLDKEVPRSADFDYYADYVLDKFACPLDAARSELASMRVKLADAERDLDLLAKVKANPCLRWLIKDLRSDPHAYGAPSAELIRDVCALLSPGDANGGG